MAPTPLTDGPQSSWRTDLLPNSRLAFVTRRPVAITMFVVALAVFGFVSLAKLRVDLLPEITYPTLTVRTTWPGAAPEDVEQRVSEKVQESLSTLDHLVRSTSISRAGVSDVVLELEWGTPMTFAVQDVREKLDSVFLPRDAERPLILRYDPNLDPILRVGVRVPAGEEARDEQGRTEQLIHLRWIAENRLKRELEALEGVAAVQVRGGLTEEIRVRVDPHRMAALRVDPTELSLRLAQENINASGGSLLEGSTEYLVRTVNQFRDIEEIEQLPVARRGDAVLRIRDVGSAERTYKKREVVSRIEGADSVELAIYREAGANIVALAERLKGELFGTDEQRAAVAEAGGGRTVGERAQVDFLQHRLRGEVQLSTLADQSTFIRDAVDDVKQAAMLGALMSVVVIWFFLRRLSATLIIGVSIPLSIVVTFAPMFMAGVSLNIMSLGGLALGVGMLVDNAIVVLESITRCREDGDGIERAAVRGVSEVSGAVVASTLTTISVFAPIVFVSGVAGQIFGDQALTVVSSLLVSLVAAVLFIPMLASRPILAGAARSEETRLDDWFRVRGLSWSWWESMPNVGKLGLWAAIFQLGLFVRYVLAFGLGALWTLVRIVLWPLTFLFNRAWDAIERVYPVVLAGALRARVLVLIGAALLFWGALERLPALGVELLPEIHQGEFTAHVKLPVGTPLRSTDSVMSQLDRDVRAVAGVEETALTVGIEAETLTREVEGPHTARLSVRLSADARDPVREDAIVAEVRALMLAHPSVQTVEVTRPTPFALESPIAVEVKGHDLDAIAAVATRVKSALDALPELSDVRSTLRPGHPEARVTFDREKTLELGLDLGSVSALVRDQVLGTVSTRFHEGDERIDVRVIGDERVLRSLQDVLDLPVNPGAETPIPLRSVAEVVEVEGPAEIRRIGNTRAIVIGATGRGLDLGGLTARIEERLATIETPEDVVVELGGQKREMDEAQTSMRFALLLAVFLVYVVMASQFESLVQPFVILLTVPLAGVGVVFTLDLLDVPLSVVVFTGLIMLAGIVVNNAIVLVDRINKQRTAGLDVRAAVLEAGRARLRPILMTTATTALGLLPLTGWLGFVPYIGDLGAGEGAELRAPMAITVVAGLVASTFLTLLVIPVVYTLLPGKRSTREILE